MDPQTNQKFWFANSVATIHVSPIEKTFPLTRSMTKNHEDPLTRVMHVPKAEGKILSLKVRHRKDSRVAYCQTESKSLNTTGLTPRPCWVESYTKWKMRVNHLKKKKHPFSCQERYTGGLLPTLHTWHQRLGHLGGFNPKRVSGIQLHERNGCHEYTTHGHLWGLFWKMDERHLKIEQSMTHNCSEPFHADLIGPMKPKARWSHARFSLIVHDDCSTFGSHSIWHTRIMLWKLS